MSIKENPPPVDLREVQILKKKIEEMRPQRYGLATPMTGMEHYDEQDSQVTEIKPKGYGLATPMTPKRSLELQKS